MKQLVVRLANGKIAGWNIDPPEGRGAQRPAVLLIAHFKRQQAAARHGAG